MLESSKEKVRSQSLEILEEDIYYTIIIDDEKDSSLDSKTQITS